MKGSRRAWTGLAAVVAVAAVASGCGHTGSGSSTTTAPSTTATSNTTAPSTTTAPTTAASSATTGRVATEPTTAAPPTTTPPLTVRVTTSPDHVFVGTEVSFSVEIRAAGTNDSEDVHFGDGGTQGANAGMVPCGDTARADRNVTFVHSYTAPGTYQFTDEVEVIGPPPACAGEDVVGAATVLVASSLQTPVGGEVQSPSGNIACGIYDGTGITNPEVHCATFSPPQTADMTPSGSVATCAGAQCGLGNPGFDVPVLAYGSAAGVGPFECVSAVTGMTCTVTGGTGFTISRSGVQRLGG